MINLVNCKNCDNFQNDYPIKIIDWKSNSPFAEDLYHFEEGYKCTCNEIESLKIEDLQKGTCRCKGVD